MKELLELAKEASLVKLAAANVVAVSRRRASYKPKKRKKSSRTSTTAIIMPKESTPDIWETTPGKYLQSAAIGAGTAGTGGYLLGGMHTWGKHTPFRGKAEDIAKKVVSQGAKLTEEVKRIKRGRVARSLAIGGAVAGMGGTAYYRHKAKKRQKELSKMPGQLIVKIPTKALFQKKAAKVELPKPKAKVTVKGMPKLKQPKTMKSNRLDLSYPSAPGPSQLKQSTKITTSPINKTAQEAAKKILNRLRGSNVQDE